ncbi:DUF296 domain-containing protein [Synechococcus sp. RSCCF101]|uniref:PCC domain-containing protein n=1 Tax=Synechococcus sp. RSCCF101 TaxID=2511069 RepID=UPI001245FA69|nr:DUF296 domain-containing protein [Synechococcus sp. RSCCF101]QEY31103.1 DUF296 domain-containing protein [Synechococcus sp. RSCCF101]
MSFLELTLSPGEDLREALEQLSARHQLRGFVVSAVGNVCLATLRFPGCGGKRRPAVLRGEHEIISLTGSLDDGTVHLHLSVAGSDGRVIGGHLERGSEVHTGAELLVARVTAALPQTPAPAPAQAVEIAVLPTCPYSARALRMLRTLSIPHRVITVRSDADRSAVESRAGSRSLPQVFIGGEAIGGYDALAEWHGSGRLEVLRAAAL